VQVFLITLSGVIANTSFRVLFSEMMPPRNEFRWFDLRYVLSCATVSLTLDGPHIPVANASIRFGSTTLQALLHRMRLTSYVFLWSSVSCSWLPLSPSRLPGSLRLPLSATKRSGQHMTRGYCLMRHAIKALQAKRLRLGGLVCNRWMGQLCRSVNYGRPCPMMLKQPPATMRE
jgi:hypothetical protein